METEEGFPPPWIRMVKKSSFAEDQNAHGVGEEGRVGHPWVRMLKKRQDSQHGSSFSRIDKLQFLGTESTQDKHGERARRAGGSRLGGLGSYRPGLWGMAAIRSLRKRELGETDKAWILRMIQKTGD